MTDPGVVARAELIDYSSARHRRIDGRCQKDAGSCQRAPLHARFGGPRSSIEEGQARVPLPVFFVLREAAAGMARDPHLGVQVHEQFDFADLGLLGFALLSARDVGAARRAVVRYGKTFQDCDE